MHLGRLQCRTKDQTPALAHFDNNATAHRFQGLHRPICSVAGDVFDEV